MFIKKADIRPPKKYQSTASSAAQWLEPQSSILILVPFSDPKHKETHPSLELILSNLSGYTVAAALAMYRRLRPRSQKKPQFNQALPFSDQEEVPGAGHSSPLRMADSAAGRHAGATEAGCPPAGHRIRHSG